MACVNSDGTITASGRQLLQALEDEHTAEEVSKLAGQPLFKVRASLRQMVEAKLVTEIDGKYCSTELGLEKASKSE